MIMVIKMKGILDFTPINRTKKHAAQASWKRVAIIKTNCELDRYYAWFLTKRFNLTLNKNLRGSHVTFINDKVNFAQFEQAAKIFAGKEIEFFIELEPRSNGEHWWLRAYCPEAENIREILGLSREPYFGLHFTLGHVNEKYLEHSEYILKICKRHELISNSPRKDLSELEIVDFSNKKEEV